MITTKKLNDFYLISHRGHIGRFLKTYNLNTIICEIGVADGVNFFGLLETAQPTLIYGIDTWNRYSLPPQPAERAYQKMTQYEYDQVKQSQYNRIKQKEEISHNIKIIKDCSSNVSSKFPDSFFDYIYIDADHSYEAVKTDIESWWPKVKTNGILAGHDYKLINDCGVKKAVDDFVVKKKIKHFSTTRERCCSWLIFKTDLDIEK